MGTANQNTSNSFFFRAMGFNSQNSGVWITTVIVILGLLFFNWDGKSVLLAYMLETIIIGAIHIAKMLVAGVSNLVRLGKTPKIMRLISITFTIVFFCIHYSIFVFVQLSMMLEVLDIKEVSSAGLFSFDFMALLQLPGMTEIYLALLLANIYYAVKNYFLPRKFIGADLNVMMFQPYIRVVIQQFLVIMGGFIILMTDAVYIVAIALVVVRTFVDLVGIAISNNREISSAFVRIFAGKDADEEDIETVTKFLNN